jgi:hypothetical protein
MDNFVFGKLEDIIFFEESEDSSLFCYSLLGIYILDIFLSLKHCDLTILYLLDLLSDLTRLSFLICIWSFFD